MKLRSALLASAMMALPVVAAQAQPVDGLYMGAGAGVNIMQRETFKLQAAGVPPIARKGDMRANLGPVVVLNLGWGFGNGLRVEGEGSYRQNTGFNNPRGFGGPGTGGGQEQKYGTMANVLYDFTMVPFVQPYVGVGAGYQFQQEDDLHLATGPVSFNQTKSSTRGHFAYQGIVGAAYPIPGMPNLALTAEYRFMGLVGERGYSVIFPNNGNVKGNAITSDNYNHSILIGMRYAFGAPPVAAAPMPVADVGAKTFLVFFDWNRADLNGSANAVVRDAAAYATRTQYTRIDVDGNADTTGTAGYNVGLSERRARAVAAEMVRNGVPQSAIQMHAYGDTKLLVPTGPGVREPQNRRVDIVYR